MSWCIHAGKAKFRAKWLKTLSIYTIRILGPDSVPPLWMVVYFWELVQKLFPLGPWYIPLQTPSNQGNVPFFWKCHISVGWVRYHVFGISVGRLWCVQDWYQMKESGLGCRPNMADRLHPAGPLNSPPCSAETLRGLNWGQRVCGYTGICPKVWWRLSGDDFQGPGTPDGMLSPDQEQTRSCHERNLACPEFWELGACLVTKLNHSALWQPLARTHKEHIWDLFLMLKILRGATLT